MVSVNLSDTKNSDLTDFILNIEDIVWINLIFVKKWFNIH